MAADDAQIKMDAQILSAGMMYRSRRRRSRPKPAVAGAGSTSSTELAEECGMLSLSRGASFDEEDDEQLVEYITRDLEPVGAVPKAMGMCLATGQENSQAGLAARRGSLTRRSSVKSETDLKEVIMKLENLGDEVNDNLTNYINAAIKELTLASDEEDIPYSGYKKVVAKLFQEFSTSWTTIAALYRMSGSLLEEIEEERGSQDFTMEKQLQTYNGKAILELAGGFWERVGGMTGLLTASKEDLYGPESAV